MQFALLRKKDTNVLGLDVSSSTIKLAELGKNGSKYFLKNFGVVSLPQDTIVDKVLRDPDQLAKAVKELVAQSRTSLTQAAVAVPDSAVITKIVQIEAHLKKMELEEQIIFEAEKHVPFPLEEVYLDFSIVGPSKKKEGMNDVLMVACRSETVDVLVQAIKMGGLTVRVVDVESNILEQCINTLVREKPAEEDQITAVFDLGSAISHLIILNGGNTIFTREEFFGSNQLIADIQKKYELSYEQALLRLRNRDFTQDFEKNVLRPFKETVVLQLRRSLQFFFSNSDYSEVDEIFLIGGNASLEGLAQMVQEQFSVVTQLANPFKNMVISSHIRREELMDMASALTVCCGLALRSFD